MDNSQSSQAAAPLWLSRRVVWIWAVFNLLSFVACYFLLERVLWSYGRQVVAPLYPAPSNSYLLVYPHAEEFIRTQLLYVCIPSLIFALLIVGVAIWRRKSVYALGAVLGLIFGDIRDYSIEWNAHFGGQALHPGAVPWMHVLLTHWMSALR